MQNTSQKSKIQSICFAVEKKRNEANTRGKATVSERICAAVWLLQVPPRRGVEASACSRWIDSYCLREGFRWLLLDKALLDRFLERFLDGFAYAVYMIKVLFDLVWFCFLFC